MKILVCIKQVPDMASRFKVNKDNVWYDETDLAFRMNEYDEYAVEQAVQVKEKLGNEPDITVLSIGPDRLVEPIKKALAMGCDRGCPHPGQCLLSKRSVADRFHHSRIWPRQKLRPHLHRHAVPGPRFRSGRRHRSRTLGHHVRHYSRRFCLSTDGIVTAKRELEGGVKAAVKFSLPALVTCQLGLNTPRYPTLPNIMKAKKKELLVFPITDFLQEKEMTATASAYAPARKGSGILLESDVNDMAERLLVILKEKTTVVK